MKTIPARIKKILSDRTKAAKKFMSLNTELGQWLIEQGINPSRWDLFQHLIVTSDCLVKPDESEAEILDFLNRW